MKVVVYNQNDVVTQVYTNIHNPKFDRDKGVITHSAGKIKGLDDPNRDVMVLEEHVPVNVGTIVTDPLKDYDQSNRFDGFDMKDITRKIEEVGEDIKKDIEKMVDEKNDKDSK